MSKAVSQKSSDDPTLNYAVFFAVFYILGYLTAILRKIVISLIPALARRMKRMPPKRKEEIITTPAYLRKGRLSAQEWEKRNLSASARSGKSEGCFDMKTSLAILEEDEKLMSEPPCWEPDPEMTRHLTEFMNRNH